jgi:hypothetical protein
MARYLFIVSRQHPALYDYLREQFAGDPNAEVLLDRRQHDRRQRETSGAPDRRRAHRRQRPRIDEELRHRSVAIVTIS